MAVVRTDNGISVAVVRTDNGTVLAQQTGTVSASADPAFSFTFSETNQGRRGLLDRGPRHTQICCAGWDRNQESPAAASAV